jgi:hypothetical protein
MSGLFTDLAARARGEAQAVRPRLPARFETSAQDPLVEISVETPVTAPADDRLEAALVERTMETIAAPAAAAPPGPGEPLAEPPAEPSPNPRSAAARRSAPDAAPAEIRVQVERSRLAADAPTPRAQSPDPPAAPALAPKVTLREPEVAAPAPLRPSAAAETSLASLERASEAPRRLAPRLTPARAGPTQSPPEQVHEETTVHVTIGRIDLRAAQVPQPPAAKPRTAATPAVMSLEDYLQSRRARR